MVLIVKLSKKHNVMHISIKAGIVNWPFDILEFHRFLLNFVNCGFLSLKIRNQIAHKCTFFICTGILQSEIAIKFPEGILKKHFQNIPQKKNLRKKYVVKSG